MTREDKIAQLTSALGDSHTMVYLLKQMFLQNLALLPDAQLDAFLAIIAAMPPVTPS